MDGNRWDCGLGCGEIVSCLLYTSICAVGDALLGAPCTLESTANTVGKLDRCKKGDAVARFHAESAFAGAGVVFEAKHDASFTAQRALIELDEARKNRDASVGVFVMAKSHAPDGFPSFARYGTNVLVTWDEDDSATDPYLCLLYTSRCV